MSVCEGAHSRQPLGMGFMDKAKEMLGKHDDKVDQGLEKGGEAAKGRFAGHDEQIDQGVDRLQEMTGDEDTVKAPPPAPEPPAPPQQPPQQ